MKTSIILIPILLLSFAGYSQDSVRTKNDKPGTPQSLRTPNTAPRSKVHVIDNNAAPNQTIHHGATESNKVNNTREQTIKGDPNNGSSTLIPQTPVITNKTTGQTDSALKKSNVTNPIRK